MQKRVCLEIKIQKSKYAKRNQPTQMQNKLDELTVEAVEQPVLVIPYIHAERELNTAQQSQHDYL